MNEFFNVSLVTLLPLSCGVAVFIVGYIKLRKLLRTKYPESIEIFSVWLIGIIAFLLGIFGQIVSMMDTFDAISHAGDISPSIVAEGIRASYKSTIIGLIVLIVSLMVWGILKGTKQKGIISRKVDTD